MAAPEYKKSTAPCGLPASLSAKFAPEKPDPHRSIGQLDTNEPINQTWSGMRLVDANLIEVSSSAKRRRIDLRMIEYQDFGSHVLEGLSELEDGLRSVTGCQLSLLQTSAIFLNKSGSHLEDHVFRVHQHHSLALARGWWCRYAPSPPYFDLRIG
ncbi:hypothetical protein CDEST_01267 [Colletotrichum destructivum]|uniref:Uncharacterized protein n=1 Tax=Colletotrichum destructivum TaxID=34406 RepID=A0AAX4HZR7_9PEZI|nr:hypothetical protein CDEST_01267 [Colletotrichum destructivum]